MATLNPVHSLTQKNGHRSNDCEGHYRLSLTVDSCVFVMLSSELHCLLWMIAIISYPAKYIVNSSVWCIT